MMAEIKIKVDPKIAKAYKAASAKEQEEVVRIVNEVIAYVLDKEKLQAFFDARETLSKEAQTKGLTPEILEEILNEKAQKISLSYFYQQFFGKIRGHRRNTR